MLFYFSLITVIATWVLLLIGGIVNPMGASLACPDWYFIPTCNGELLPEMVGGVLYEHGHRLWASMVGLLTLAQCVWIYAKGDSARPLRRAAFVSVLLVAVQGTFGGVTVLLGLSAVLSSVHLLTAMLFFCLLIWISFQLSHTQVKVRVPTSTDTAIKLGIALLLVQILLGGVVRHLGAGLSCGNDWLTCGPQLWPSWHLGQIHMTHRFFGYAVFGVVLWSNIKAFKEAKKQNDEKVLLLSMLPTLLVVCQIALGLLTVATVRSVPVVVMHTAIGALVLASQFTLLLRRSLDGSRNKGEVPC